MSSKRNMFSPATLLSVVLLAGALLLVGCDSTKFDRGSPSPDHQSPLSPNVRMKISFDQTEVTFSNTLPPGLVGDTDDRTNSQAKDTNGEPSHMTEYEKTFEARSYDKDGYLTVSYEYIEGSRPHMNMPADAYSDVKRRMPYNAEDENPVARLKLEGGTMKHIRENGEVERTRSVDPERFRVDPATLDSLEALNEDTVTTGAREARARQALQRRSLSTERMSNHHVAFQKRIQGRGNLSSVRQVVDLRYGKPVHLTYKRENGNVAMIETRTYGRFSGVPVMRSSVVYHYGEKSGEHTVTSRSETTRENITVRFN